MCWTGRRTRYSTRWLATNDCECVRIGKGLRIRKPANQESQDKEHPGNAQEALGSRGNSAPSPEHSGRIGLCARVARGGRAAFAVAPQRSLVVSGFREATFLVSGFPDPWFPFSTLAEPEPKGEWECWSKGETGKCCIGGQTGSTESPREILEYRPALTALESGNAAQHPTTPHGFGATSCTFCAGFQ
jgi:hypothetical protein